MDQPIKFNNKPIPSDLILYKTKHSFVVLHPLPFLINHLIVSPINAKKSITQVSDEEGQDMMVLIKRVMNKLKNRNQGFTVYIRENNKQFYVHLVPRNFNDLKENQSIYEDNSLVDPNFEVIDKSIKRKAEELRRLINDEG